MKQQKKQKIQNDEMEIPLKQKKRMPKQKYQYCKFWLDDELEDDLYSSFQFFKIGRA